jgi:hypothetical protein
MFKPGWEIRFGYFSKLNVGQTILISSATRMAFSILNPRNP